MNTARTICALLILSPFTAYAWEYAERQDDMTGKPIREAKTLSQNELDLGFPYGVVSGHLHVRIHPRYGRDVVVRIDKGQMLCHTSGDCPVLVRFDDAKPIQLNGNPPADRSTEVIFLGSYDRLVSSIRKSKVARVETNFYQRGAQTLIFDVTGFPEEMTQATNGKQKKK